MNNPPQRRGTFPTLLPSPDARLPLQLLTSQQSPGAPTHSSSADGRCDAALTGVYDIDAVADHRTPSFFLRYPHSNILSVSLRRMRLFAPPAGEGCCYCCCWGVRGSVEY